MAKKTLSVPLHVDRMNSLLNAVRVRRFNNGTISLATRNPRPPPWFPLVTRTEARVGTKEEKMNAKRFILAGCATLILSASTAMAGPCDTSGRAANLKDAGSGPASAGSGQTTGVAADPKGHPPTETMNRAAGDVATSSQDTQKQMQGQPTAAQQAQGAKPDEKAADKNCD